MWIYRACQLHDHGLANAHFDNTHFPGASISQSFLGIEHALCTAVGDVFKAKYPEAFEEWSVSDYVSNPQLLFKEKFPAAYAEWMAHCDERQKLDTRRFLEAQKFHIETLSLPDRAVVFLIPDLDQE